MYQIPRNALALMLAAQVLVILPHLGRLPIWLTLFCMGCIAWRVMVHLGRWSFPGKWVKTSFVFGGVLGIGLGMTLFLIALTLTDAAVVATLSSMTPVALLPLIWIVTRQRPALLAWVGAGLAGLGTALLLYQ